MIVEKIKLKRIEFKTLNFDCIVCLNSNFPSKIFFKQFTKSKILAVDGAAIRLYRKGILADYVIGDLDSFNKSKVKKEYKHNKIIYDASQETNDFQKALDFAVKKGLNNVLIVGFHGGELEHTLNNWSILFKYKDILNLCIYEKKRYAIPIEGEIELECKIGEIISLIPQTKAQLTTRNLKWKLEDEIIEYGIREGARNQATEDLIYLNVKNGSILLFFDARLPFAPKK